MSDERRCCRVRKGTLGAAVQALPGSQVTDPALGNNQITDAGAAAVAERCQARSSRISTWTTTRSPT
jgi:hypothetical protein